MTSAKKLQKTKAKEAGSTVKIKYNRCSKATKTVKVAVLEEFELLYDTPRGDEDIIRDIRLAYLGE